jgi:hypothetical protein
MEVGALNGALSDPPLWVGGVGAETVTPNRPVGDEQLQLLSSLATTRVQLAVFVEAVLVSLRRIDAVEAIRLAVDADCVGVFTVRRHGGKESHRNER